MDLSARIDHHGWRQGSFLPPELIACATCLKGKPAPVEADSLFLVVTQSCDLQHHEIESEPWCEVIRVRRIAESKGVFEDGRNGRRLHCQVFEQERPFSVEILAHDRYFVPRELLCDHAPLNGFEMDDIDALADWLGRRYSRPALPGKFNDRIKSQEKALRGLLKKHHQLFRGFYLRLFTFDELPDDQPYAVKLLLVAHHTAFEGNNAAIGEFVRKFREILGGCLPKLDIKEVNTLSDNTATLLLLDAYIPWDIFDYLTTRDDGAPPAATIAPVHYL